MCVTGNHALALAYHGKLLGIPVTCVMPNIAPLTKITSCQELGARVILHGSHILEAREKADEFARDEVRPCTILRARVGGSWTNSWTRTQGLAYINGFDHPDIIAGAGTMGIEILNQVRIVLMMTISQRLLAAVHTHFQRHIHPPRCRMSTRLSSQLAAAASSLASHSRSKRSHRT